MLVLLASSLFVCFTLALVKTNLFKSEIMQHTALIALKYIFKQIAASVIKSKATDKKK